MLWHRCFPVNFGKFLGTSFLQNTSGRLLLKLRRNFLDWRVFLVLKMIILLLLIHSFQLSGLRQFLATESPLKFTKNVFYFTLKISIRKISLISKFIPSQPSQQTIALHMLPNIPRGKGNQTVKFGQLINYKTRNIFLFKVIQKMWWRNYFHAFFQKTHLSISLDQ